MFGTICFSCLVSHRRPPSSSRRCRHFPQLRPDGSSCSRCAPAVFYLLRVKRNWAVLPIHLFDPGLTFDPFDLPLPPTDGEALWCRAPAATSDLRRRGCRRLKVSSVTEGGQKEKGCSAFALFTGGKTLTSFCVPYEPQRKILSQQSDRNSHDVG